MNNIQSELLATDLSPLRKKGIFIVILLFNLFPFFIVYKALSPDMNSTMWELRNFIGIAAFQTLAQVSLAFYVLKNKVPNYVVGSVFIISLVGQVTYGIAVILVANA